MEIYHYISWDCDQASTKPAPIEEFLELYGKNYKKITVDKNTVKKKIKLGEWEVVNLQVNGADKLVRRNPGDSPTGQKHIKIISKYMNELCSMYSKLPGVTARCKEMRIEINNGSFVGGGRGEVVSAGNVASFDIWYSIADGYYVFIDSNSSMSELEGTPRIEDAIAFIKKFIYENINVSFKGTNIESGLVASIQDFAVDKTGTYIKPSIIAVRGSEKSCKDFLKSLSQYNLSAGHKVDSANGILFVKLNLGEKGLPNLLKLCNTFGSRLNVNTSNEQEKLYLKEINNYYNKKACAIQSNGILNIKK